ncbi:Dps family protein [Agrobacterium tumefaciens]|uniref:Dps family protein n=1 Tax=Agrobacterium tumefaciens TaxID=358 RepID=UPI0015745792|nr:DNA starvation/stationary phase protection protein [Agrobacterium tumefaciens]WCK22230.1 DNA starvation/stationary phase protection protein [Agrobacterium tumefaciens]
MKPKGGAFAPLRRPQPSESRRTLERFASSVIVNSFSGKSVKSRAAAALRGPTGLDSDAVRDISAGAPTVLADVFALYIKTKNFHWHMSGSDFRDYHLLLDEHGDELFAMTDPLAEWVRKVGGDTLRSIGDISRKQQIADNDADCVHPHGMLAELRDDNGSLVASMRSLHDVCDEYGDGATASLIENWIDKAEKRVWFPFEILRDTNGQ